jgi:hypothetical protein
MALRADKFLSRAAKINRNPSNHVCEKVGFVGPAALRYQSKFFRIFEKFEIVFATIAATCLRRRPQTGDRLHPIASSGQNSPEP